MLKKVLFLSISIVSVLAFTFPGQVENKGIKNELTGFNSPGSPFDFESQWALVIGINNYSYYNNLRHAQPEAGAIKELLITSYGFNPRKVKFLYDDNAAKDIIMEQLKSFVVNLKETDNLFIYFSGHGFVDHILKIFYWLPADAGKDRREIRDKNQRISRSNIKISSEEIRGILKECKAKHIFVVADSCFAVKLFALESKKGRLPGYYKRKSRQLFASGRELVGDGVFGKYFIDYLKTNEAPYIMASDLI